MEENPDDPLAGAVRGRDHHLSRHPPSLHLQVLERGEVYWSPVSLSQLPLHHPLDHGLAGGGPGGVITQHYNNK